MTEIRLQVSGFSDSDSEERAELAWRLQDELRELDIADLSRPAVRTPGGAKGDALQWAELVVTLAGSLPALIAAVRGWLGRHPGAVVTAEIDGDRLALTETTEGERREVIAAWMARHGG